MLKKIKPYILPLLVGIALPLTVGLLSAFLTMDGYSIFGELKKPPLSPPPILFPIVWTILYILMGISSAIVFVKRGENKACAFMGLRYYFLSLLFNFGWGLIFFNSGAFLIAFIWLCVLLYLIIKTVIMYFKVDKAAALLQLPYIIWVIFAGYLNFGIFLLNK